MTSPIRPSLSISILRHISACLSKTDHNEILAQVFCYASRLLQNKLEYRVYGSSVRHMQEVVQKAFLKSIRILLASQCRHGFLLWLHSVLNVLLASLYGPCQREFHVWKAGRYIDDKFSWWKHYACGMMNRKASSPLFLHPKLLYNHEVAGCFARMPNSSDRVGFQQGNKLVIALQAWVGLPESIE